MITEVVPNLFTKEECLSFIDRAENIGFTPAICNYSNGKKEFDTNVRDSLRCEYTSKEFSKMIFDRISATFSRPKFFKGINDNIRFLKYTPGQKFEKHHDAPRTNDTREYTFVIYLSNCKGGDTIIHRYPDQKVSVEAGKVLIFDKGLLHSSSAVEEGIKYAIVGDIYQADEKPSPYNATERVNRPSVRNQFGHPGLMMMN